MGGHCSIQEEFMFKFRFAISAAVAALALGSASAMAMQQTNSGGQHPDNHGAVVSSAARTTCHTVTDETHGQCVSAIASTNGQAHRNGAGAAHVKACKAQGLKGRDFGACVSGHPKSQSTSSDSSDASDADEGDSSS
jgi:hypothetical protein